MAMDVFLAMTAAEIYGKRNLPANLGWMACHFSPYGTGLSNLPKQLPASSLLIVDDITPIHCHDPQHILDQLADCAERFRCRGILLDFQRPGIEETSALVEFLAQALPYPLAVSSVYANAAPCAVCLPPVPPSEPPEDWFSPWSGRELWLELSSEGEEITVGEQGSNVIPVPFPTESDPEFHEGSLCCHYSIVEEADKIKFLLRRTKEDLSDLLTNAESFGVTTAVGLYQEFHKIKTALHKQGGS